MNLFASLLAKTISPREIFYFSTPLLNTDEPHYFVLVNKAQNEVLVFTCCTSQLEKRERYVISKGYPMSTLVAVDPTPENGLTTRTLIDCNTIFQYTLAEFIKWNEDGKVTCKGEISDIYYEQVLIGLQASMEISQEDKDRLPKP